MDNEAFQKATSGCEHDYELNEEIGMCCKLCGHVGSEIRDVSAPFVSSETLEDAFFFVTSSVLIMCIFTVRRDKRNGPQRLSISTKKTLTLM